MPETAAKRRERRKEYPGQFLPLKLLHTHLMNNDYTSAIGVKIQHGLTQKAYDKAVEKAKAEQRTQQQLKEKGLL